jgi:hypothetical protein
MPWERFGSVGGGAGSVGRYKKVEESRWCARRQLTTTWGKKHRR